MMQLQPMEIVLLFGLVGAAFAFGVMPPLRTAWDVAKLIERHIARGGKYSETCKMLRRKGYCVVPQAAIPRDAPADDYLRRCRLYWTVAGSSGPGEAGFTVMRRTFGIGAPVLLAIEAEGSLDIELHGVRPLWRVPVLGPLSGE